MQAVSAFNSGTGMVIVMFWSGSGSEFMRYCGSSIGGGIIES